MKNLQVPRIVEYAMYDLTDADEMVLRLFLDMDTHCRVVNRDPMQSLIGAQKVAAIRWFRTRFACGLKEAKDAVDHYYNQHTTKAATEENYTCIGYVYPGGEDYIYGTDSVGRVAAYTKNP